MFILHDAATTEIYTLFPTRRSSDLLGERDHLAPDVDALARAELGSGERDVAEPAGVGAGVREQAGPQEHGDRKSTRLNSSHMSISYAVFCLKKKTTTDPHYLICIHR